MNERADSASTAKVRRQLSVGMAMMSMREGLGLLVRFAGIIAIGRLIGPHDFGVYAVASGVTFVASIVAQLGVEVFLIRRDAAADQQLLHEVFSLLVVTTTTVGLVQAGIGGVVRFGFGQHAVGLAIAVSALAVPLNVLWSPALGAIEHRMDYTALGLIELAGDVLLYGVGITAALLGWRYWAPLAGMFAWQAWLLLAAYRTAPFHPRWRWNRATNGEVLSFGGRLLLSQLAGRVKELFLPMVTGATLGVQASGFAQTSVRLAESAGFVQRLAGRLVLSSGSRLRGNERASQALLVRATRIQIALTVVCTLPLTLFPVVVVQHTLGAKWVSIASVLPIFVLALVAVPTFSTVSQMLVVNNDLSAATRLNLVRSATWLLGTVGLGLAFGLTGVAVAEVISVAATGSLALWLLWKRSHTAPTPLISVALLAPITMWTKIGAPMRWFLPLPAFLLVLIPWTRGDIAVAMDMGRSLISRTRSRGGSDAVGEPGPAPVERVMFQLTSPVAPGQQATSRFRRSQPPRHLRSRHPSVDRPS